ncbi:hypothetical protein HAX54_014844 [Datura stramonium]|uniref:Uncharacterized protein n=1 Tax=Datura stramonium TaxID=4076 RepID=A0ABS8TNQ8_DATST|nr:hypothetical protein [Datura stramonium]
MKWEEVAGLKDGRFSREFVDAIGYRGKLCMVNVKDITSGKQGAVYDVTEDEWEEMPEGMLGGWNGPAATTINDESEMYAVDETKGSLSKYVPEIDQWEELIESCDDLKSAEQITAEWTSESDARVWDVEGESGGQETGAQGCEGGGWDGSGASVRDGSSKAFLIIY